MKSLTNQEMFRAMITDDSRYDGKFFVCVKSTSIYCLPSCKAKVPLRKNIVFYTSREKAISAGFRGCKRCRSEFYPDIAPPWFSKAVDFMKSAVGEKLSEKELAVRAGVDISTIRRYYKAYLETTPMAYHRRLRLEYAKGLLEQGTDYLAAAFECGFESSSGFRDAFRKYFGCAPGRIDAI